METLTMTVLTIWGIIGVIIFGGLFVSVRFMKKLFEKFLEEEEKEEEA